MSKVIHDCREDSVVGPVSLWPSKAAPWVAVDARSRFFDGGPAEYLGVGRSSEAALYHQFGIRLRGVFDTQAIPAPAET